MSLQRWGLPILIIIGALLAWASIAFQALSLLRPALIFGYVLIGTGIGWIRLLNVARGVTEWALAIALSLAVATIAAMGMLYTDQWSPERWIALLAILGITGALLTGVYYPRSNVAEL